MQDVVTSSSLKTEFQIENSEIELMPLASLTQHRRIKISAVRPCIASHARAFMDASINTPTRYRRTLARLHFLYNPS
jgi:hypothetical protein